MATYDPDADRRGNPIACVTAWIGGLFRGRAPGYETPAHEAPVHEPPVGRTPAVARVRGVDVRHAHPYAAGGDACPESGSIVTLTLLVDDDATASTIVDALHSGAAIRVATLAASD